MRRLLILSLLILVSATQPTTRPAATDDGMSVYFSPDGNCTWAIVDQISRAKSTIDVQEYVLTSKPILHALAEANHRGVKVRAVLDKMQATTKFGGAAFLVLSGIPVWIDKQHPIAHNKVIIIDGETVVCGSFNLTECGGYRNEYFHVPPFDLCAEGSVTI